MVDFAALSEKRKKTSKKSTPDLMGDTIKGTISRLHCAYESFSAGKLESQDRVNEVSFTAPVQLVQGTRVILHGRWVQDPKFGAQFKAEQVEYDLSIDNKGLALWLEKNKQLVGIGRSKALRIAETFGDNFDEVITNTPKKIQALVGLSDEQMEILRMTWDDYRDYHKLITWLAGFGLSIHEIEEIKNKYGNEAMGILQADPYLIVGEIPRFGFKTVDKIALKMGIPKHHESRLKHGILCCVRDWLDEGSTYIELLELVRRANTVLELDVLNSRQIIRSKIEELVEKRLLTKHTIKQGDSDVDIDILILPDIERMETFLAETFSIERGDKLWKDDENWKFNDPNCFDEELTRVVPPDKQLNDDQRSAVFQALTNSVSLISGGAGTGKTFTIKTITDLFEANGKHVELCAPTGKAARRMEEATSHYAQTIHRLLEFNPKLGGFQRKASFPLTCDVVIIDEFSMVDSILGYHLFDAILPTTAVIIVGDHNQLPPVGPGNILRDLIQSKRIPTTILNTVVRQAGVLKKNSSAILEGRVEKTCKPEEGGGVPWQVVGTLTDALECQRFLLNALEKILVSWPTADIVHGIQILSPQKKGHLGCDTLNVALQKIVQRVKWQVEVEPTVEGKRPKLYVNDKVIQVKNDYKLDVMNGTLGQVIEVTDDGIVVEFEGKEFPVVIPSDKRINVQLAYALTIHKCQGSEFPYVLLVIHKAHNFMHTRNLLYTGATRAKKKLIIAGDGWGIRNCAGKVSVDKRKTWLSELLKNA